MVRLEGNVGRSNCKNAKVSSDHGGTLVGEDGNEGLGLDIMFDERMSDRLGISIELSVGLKVIEAVLYGHLVWSKMNLLCKEGDNGVGS